MNALKPVMAQRNKPRGGVGQSDKCAGLPDRRHPDGRSQIHLGHDIAAIDRHAFHIGMHKRQRLGILRGRDAIDMLDRHGKTLGANAHDQTLGHDAGPLRW